jgi:hypothetical protein
MLSWGMTFWQAVFAILVAVPLWASVHPARQLVRDWLGRSRFVLSVAPGSLPIDRVNQVLGVNTHYITRYEAVSTGVGLEEVRLEFAGLTEAARTKILSDLRRFAPASHVRLETGGAILQPVFG